MTDSATYMPFERELYRRMHDSELAISQTQFGRISTILAIETALIGGLTYLGKQVMALLVVHPWTSTGVVAGLACASAGISLSVALVRLARMCVLDELHGVPHAGQVREYISKLRVHQTVAPPPTADREAALRDDVENWVAGRHCVAGEARAARNHVHGNAHAHALMAQIVAAFCLLVVLVLLSVDHLIHAA